VSGNLVSVAICSVFMAGASSPASLRASRSRRLGKETNRSDLFKKPAVPFAFALILADAILVALIIAYVPYTKIDWDAYMSQVSVNGQLWFLQSKLVVFK
jgi:hypothetical protein